MNRRTRRFSAALLTIASILGGAVTSAAETPRREIVGWTGDADSVVVRLVQRGERMVDGMSKDYYFEATELWSVSDGKVEKRFKHDEASGSPPAIYTEARPAKEWADLEETVGVSKAVHDATSPAGTHRLQAYSAAQIAAPGDGKYQCKGRYRVVSLSRDASRVHTLIDERFAGPRVSRRDGATCPAVDVQPAWSADGKQWVALVGVGDDVTLRAGRVDALDRYAHADIVVALPAIATITSGAEATAWTALSSGRWDAAKLAFQEAGVAGGPALTSAMKGDGKAARKAADGAYRDSDEGAEAKVLRAAAWVASGETAKTGEWIDEALAAASSFPELVKFAAIFALVDLKIANQIAIHALSHPTAKEADTNEGWTLLASGLLRVGEYSKAEEALGHVAKPTGATLVAQAMLHLDRDEKYKAQRIIDDFFFSNSGRCEAYLLAGRSRAKAGENAAARSLFDSAAFCDPTLAEALFYSADYARLAGDLESARSRFERYLAVAPAVRFDEVRSARRGVAGRWARRFSHEGVVLVDGSCRRLGGAFLCSGTIRNTGDDVLPAVRVEVVRKGKKLGTTKLENLEPNRSRPFGVRFEAKSLSDVMITAGRNRSERKLNATPAH